MSGSTVTRCTGALSYLQTDWAKQQGQHGPGGPYAIGPVPPESPWPRELLTEPYLEYLGPGAAGLASPSPR